MIWPKQGISFSVRVKRCLAFSRPARIPARCRRRMRYRIRHRCQRSRRLWGRNGVRSATPHIPVGKPPVRQIGVEFNMSSTRAREMRLILVNGEATVNRVDDRAREATFHILSGNKIRKKTLFRTPPRNTTKPQVRSGVFEKSAHHFASKEGTPFGIIRTGIRTTPAPPFAMLGTERRLER